MSDNKNIPTPPMPGKLPDKRENATPEELKKGKGLKGWSLFFFIMTCIATGLIAASIALPFFIIIFGILSVIVWLVLIVVVTIFTLGLVWTIDDVKVINQGWMSFNDKLFNSSEAIANIAIRAIPTIAIIGASFVFITWILMIIGISTDKNRKRYYTGMLIALGVITLLYAIIAIISLVVNSNPPAIEA